MREPLLPSSTFRRLGAAEGSPRRCEPRGSAPAALPRILWHYDPKLFLRVVNAHANPVKKAARSQQRRAANVGITRPRRVGHKDLRHPDVKPRVAAPHFQPDPCSVRPERPRYAVRLPPGALVDRDARLLNQPHRHHGRVRTRVQPRVGPDRDLGLSGSSIRMPCANCKRGAPDGRNAASLCGHLHARIFEPAPCGRGIPGDHCFGA